MIQPQGVQYLVPDVLRQFNGSVFKGRDVKVFEDGKITMSQNVGNQIPSHSRAVPNNGHLNFTFDSNTVALTFALRSVRSGRLGLLTSFRTISPTLSYR